MREMSYIRPRLRSPREMLGGYIILPRLIDKVRLHAEGKLPPEYVQNLLVPGLTLDGRFLTFTGLDAETLREAILSVKTDKEIHAWVERHALARTPEERMKWVEEIDSYRPASEWVEFRKKTYPELAEKIDVASVSVLDLVDMDEGRIPVGDD